MKSLFHYGLVSLTGAAFLSVASANEPRPNFLFILADDLGYADVGFTGGKEIKTPNIDTLAAAGARLEQFYVQPLCSPTRASLMTGRYPMRYGMQVGVLRPWEKRGLSLEERLLPKVLKEAGYTTAIVGKWHLGQSDRVHLPTARGFDHQYGHYSGAIDYFTHIRDEANRVLEALEEAIHGEAKRGAAVVFSSHQLDLVEDVCDDIAIIDKGRTVLKGALRDIRQASPYRYVQLLLRAEKTSLMSAMEGVRVLWERDGEIRWQVPRDADPHRTLGGDRVQHRFAQSRRGPCNRLATTPTAPGRAPSTSSSSSRSRGSSSVPTLRFWPF